MFYDPFSADFTEDLSGILNRAVCGYRQLLSGGLAEATPDRAAQSNSKIIAALTFPKLAQLWTGQVRAARAGISKKLSRLVKTP